MVHGIHDQDRRTLVLGLPAGPTAFIRPVLTRVMDEVRADWPGIKRDHGKDHWAESRPSVGDRQEPVQGQFGHATGHVAAQGHPVVDRLGLLDARCRSRYYRIAVTLASGLGLR